MIELLKGKKGSVGMVCHDSTSTTGKQRCEGFKEYFKANAPADLKLLDEQIAGEVTKAADTSKAIIQANDDIVGMYGSNEAAASGIVQGVAESGKDGQDPDCRHQGRLRGWRRDPVAREDRLLHG